jgi:hypothetical protein
VQQLIKHKKNRREKMKISTIALASFFALTSFNAFAATTCDKAKCNEEHCNKFVSRVGICLAECGQENDDYKACYKGASAANKNAADEIVAAVLAQQQ